MALLAQKNYPKTILPTRMFVSEMPFKISVNYYDIIEFACIKNPFICFKREAG